MLIDISEEYFKVWQEMEGMFVTSFSVGKVRAHENCVRPSQFKRKTVKNQIKYFFDPEKLEKAGIINYDDAVKLHNSSQLDASGKINCVPTYSEALTREGWKSLDKLTDGEEILISDWDCNLYWAPAKKLLVGKKRLSRFDHKSGSILTTSDHRNFINSRKGHKQIRLTSELVGKDRVDLIATGRIKKSSVENLDMYKILGFVLGDGGITGRNKTSIIISVKKERKKEYLESTGFNFDYIVDSGEYRKYSVNSESALFFFDYFDKNKKIYFSKFLELSVEQMLAVLEGMVQSDGRYVANKLISSFTNTEGDLLSLFSTLLHLTDNIAGKVTTNDNRKGYGVNSEVVKDVSYVQRISDGRQKFLSYSAPLETEDYMECGCVNVETGLWLMRQNGRIVITGNCTLGTIIHSIVLPELEKRLRNQGINAITEYPLISRELACIGTADLLVFHDAEKKIDIYDLKTTGPGMLKKTKNASEEYKLQLLSYGLMLEDIFPDYKVGNCVIVYACKTPRSKVTELDPDIGELVEYQLPMVGEYQTTFDSIKGDSIGKMTMLEFFHACVEEVKRINGILVEKIDGYDHWLFNDKLWELRLEGLSKELEERDEQH